VSVRHFLEVDDLSPEELALVLDLAAKPHPPRVLEGRGMALVFEKPSARTRNSTEMAVYQLGGHPVSIRGDEVGLDTRETAEDVARTLGCYHAAIGVRVFDHSVLVRMAGVATVPVVNLLSDAAHPCQALADLLTLREEFGSLTGRKVAWVGDGNNVSRSFLLAAAMSGMDVAVATPEGYALSDTFVERARRHGVQVTTTIHPEEAVEGADAVATDVWASMGQEVEADKRRAAFAGYTVDTALLDRAAPTAILLHCLPAHRGEEVSADAVDGPRSRVWRQATNRMHAARGLLLWLLS
jgi:ornithine carbamoyltransferase